MGACIQRHRGYSSQSEWVGSLCIQRQGGGSCEGGGGGVGPFERGAVTVYSNHGA